MKLAQHHGQVTYFIALPLVGFIDGLGIGGRSVFCSPHAFLELDLRAPASHTIRMFSLHLLPARCQQPLAVSRLPPEPKLVLSHGVLEVPAPVCMSLPRISGILALELEPCVMDKVVGQLDLARVFKDRIVFRYGLFALRFASVNPKFKRRCARSALLRRCASRRGRNIGWPVVERVVFFIFFSSLLWSRRCHAQCVTVLKTIPAHWPRRRAASAFCARQGLEPWLFPRCAGRS
ncbi:hypothetical protein AWB83_06513 [Caballeronia ptereochthonis]|uniref:Uncharacterized protein n=1 Tax=Caballeronia ptereochthonis TaxID=1777144 RepID=A0A158E5B6_9BURK|nr:hypothetical protein AWB83_06513 [Caballeronia ptereochthonis]